jgi:hypothetical protein
MFVSVSNTDSLDFAIADPPIERHTCSVRIAAGIALCKVRRLLSAVKSEFFR